MKQETKDDILIAIKLALTNPLRLAYYAFLMAVSALIYLASH